MSFTSRQIPRQNPVLEGVTIYHLQVTHIQENEVPENEQPNGNVKMDFQGLALGHKHTLILNIAVLNIYMIACRESLPIDFFILNFTHYLSYCWLSLPTKICYDAFLNYLKQAQEEKSGLYRIAYYLGSAASLAGVGISCSVSVGFAILGVYAATKCDICYEHDIN